MYGLYDTICSLHATFGCLYATICSVRDKMWFYSYDLWLYTLFYISINLDLIFVVQYVTIYSFIRYDLFSIRDDLWFCTLQPVAMYVTCRNLVSQSVSQSVSRSIRRWPPFTANQGLTSSTCGLSRGHTGIAIISTSCNARTVKGQRDIKRSPWYIIL